jgi:hypothetical protein
MKRDRRSFGQIGVAAADRLLEQGRGDPWVYREGLGDRRTNRAVVISRRSADAGKQIAHVGRSQEIILRSQ